MMNNYLFVYGTLKRNQANHHIINECPFITEAEIPGRLYYLGHRHYPYAITDKGWGPTSFNDPMIHGEVYSVTMRVLNWLDQLEGCPNHYHRVRARTISGYYVHIYEPSDATIDRATVMDQIPSGRFN